jgi:uncharacterized damage-inducible protein DinB
MEKYLHAREEITMKLTDFFLAQLEREAPLNQRALERIPEGRGDFKPHEKSMPFGYLSELVATMPSWIAMAIDQDDLDLAPPGGSGARPPSPGTTRELLKAHDDAVLKAKASLRKTTDEHLMTPWRLLVGGKVVMEQPRHIVIADTFGHLAHHRGQLTVYLRLLGAPVPAIYGPSADEKTFG